MKEMTLKNVFVADSVKQGKGVFAKRNFKKGELILQIDDSHVVTDESALTSEQHEFDLDYLASKIIVMQAPEKYINHSCDPNSYVKTRNGIREVLAMRDIATGEEITYDYSINGENEGSFPCRCGNVNCRGMYQGDFFKLPLERQKEYLPYLDDWFIKKHRDQVEELRN